MKISYKQILPFLLGTGMLGGCATSHDGNLARYVVTDRADNKIVFENVVGVPTKRVMTFEDADLVYYRAIHIGDTIGCAQPFSDTQLVVGVKNANIRLISRGDILRMYELQQQTAKRDSLINNMNTRQK
ncbi:MAG: hypothetical protein NC311_01635 [Muribaculaceae bacterium]|nr:hypothetical protein [Muribaculaceae bacterium]